MNQPYPWAFVGQICIFALMAPTAWRFRVRNRWRFSLSAFFVLPVIVALMTMSLLQFREAIHNLDEVAHEWSNAWWPEDANKQTSDQELDAGIPYRPMPEILVAALKHAVIPASCALSVSLFASLCSLSSRRVRSNPGPDDESASQMGALLVNHPRRPE